MRATVDFCRSKFAEFNDRMFAGRLPVPPIELTDAATFLGKCVYSTLPADADGNLRYSNFRLRFSTRWDLPESELEDVVIHEMIHYFILYNGLHDTSSHGQIFKSLMASINAAYGRHINISHRESSEGSSHTATLPSTDAGRPSWRIIAVLCFKSGARGLKVLPKIVDRVQHYCQAASRHPDLSRIELYLHDNPFFSRHPSSGALKYHSIESKVLDTQLQGARLLKLEGNQLSEVRRK